MLIKQLSVFVENKPGRLAAVIEALGKNNVNMSALSLADTSEYGILRVIVDNPEAAVEILKGIGVIVKITKVLAVSMDDTPGGLSKILDVFLKNEINVDYMYAFVGKAADRAVMVVKVSDVKKAEDALLAAGIQTLDADDVYRA
ncbi:MAG: ACT domain-containing protein [Clostridia bacterium]|nr:ACT domain-containing protein [Clostridia bacterium]HAL63688.1 acetolactate synthase [Clostridiales bacterium]